jgi:hypothetical protein
MNLFLALALSLSASAAAPVTGLYVAKHDVTFMAYDKKECLENGGKWAEEDAGCVLEGQDSVEIVAAGKGTGKFLAKVETIATNGHSCGYDGVGTFVSARELVVSADSEIFVPGENGEQDKVVPATCELKITFGAGNRALTATAISSYEACHYFCGANAVLEVSGAKRKQ